MSYDDKQIILGNSLDLRVPIGKKEYFEKFNIDFKIAESSIENGCHITDLNKQLFRKFDIPLKETYISYSKIPSSNSEGYIAETIKKYLSQDIDVILTLDYNIMSFDEMGTPCGHALLVNDLSEGNLLTYTNPDTAGSKLLSDCFRINDLLVKAMTETKLGGLWVIERI